MKLPTIYYWRSKLGAAVKRPLPNPGQGRGQKSEAKRQPFLLRVDAATAAALRHLKETKWEYKALCLLLDRTEQILRQKGPHTSQAKVLRIKDILDEVKCSRNQLYRLAQGFVPNDVDHVGERRRRLAGATPALIQSLQEAYVKDEVRTAQEAIDWVRRKTKGQVVPSPATIYRWLSPFIKKTARPHRRKTAGRHASEVQKLAQLLLKMLAAIPRPEPDLLGSDNFRLYFVARNLLQVQIDCEARLALKNRALVTNEVTKRLAINSIRADPWYSHWVGTTPNSQEQLGEWIQMLVGQLHDCPRNMIVDSRLRERVPSLRPVQCKFLRREAFGYEQNLTSQKFLTTAPPVVANAIKSLLGAFVIFIDTLYPDSHGFARPQEEHTETFALSQALFRQWQLRASCLEPGDAYVLVDEFAQILSLRSWYEWQIDRSTPTETGLARTAVVEGATPSTGGDIPRTVRYCLDALQRYQHLSKEDRSHLAFDSSWLMHDRARADCTNEADPLPAVSTGPPGALQLFCLAYTGFRLLAPEHDLGICLEGSFKEASEQFERTGKAEHT